MDQAHEDRRSERSGDAKDGRDKEDADVLLR
jgi:hypothetical protein